jgi:hypothetical protein
MEYFILIQKLIFSLNQKTMKIRFNYLAIIQNYILLQSESFRAGTKSKVLLFFRLPE